MNNEFKFEISLSVLNHLGRNLYRNIITVIGEAISNSWDADAENVKIYINKDKNNMYIIDDGKGMTEEDFQTKFLRIGYSKRSNDNFKSERGRPFIGRKGIGKLALLSCADRIHIITKTKNTDFIGGIIDNSNLDKEITEDSESYTLEKMNVELESLAKHLTQGTLIYFEGLKNEIINTVEFLQKLIALHFKFSLIDKSFNIFVNDEKITEKNLSTLAEKTQFIWKINEFNEPFIDLMTNLVRTKSVKSKMNIKGYIATVQKPSDIKIRSANEKVTLDLFVNGRLREKDILKHFPTSRIVENYVYGQIHYDKLDEGNSTDIFTSSREGLLSESKEFQEFINEINNIFRKIIEDWDAFRVENGDAGDPDNESIPLKIRKANELFSETLKDISNGQNNEIVTKWTKELKEEAKYNIPTYTECFIAENLLRYFIKHKNISYDKMLKNIKKFKNDEKTAKRQTSIYYEIRKSPNDLNYLGMLDLAKVIAPKNDKDEKVGLIHSANTFKPVRDAVAHTSTITDLAKERISLECANIKSHITYLIKEVNKESEEQK